MMRRLGPGRLSEIIPPAVAGSGSDRLDRTMRALGVYRRAQDSVSALSPGTRSMLEAYAAGVNASHRRRRPGRLRAPGVHTAAGAYARAVAAGRLAGVGQADGAQPRRQLARRTVARCGCEQDRRRRRCKFLISRGDDSDPRCRCWARRCGMRLDSSIAPPTTSPPASARRRTNGCCRAPHRRGKPLLANDPHLGLRPPASGISRASSGRASTSAAPPRRARPPSARPQRPHRLGLHHHQPRQPGPVRRARRPHRSRSYVTPDGARPFAVREETSTSAGASRCTLRVRQTRHGAVISDVAGPKRRPQSSGPATCSRCRPRRSTPPTPRPKASSTRPGAATGRSSDGGAQDRLADAEHGLCRYRREHRLDLAGARADPPQGRRLPAGAGLDRRVRLGGLRAVRRTAARLQPGRAASSSTPTRAWCRDNYRHFISRDWAEPYRQRRATTALAVAPAASAA